MSAFLQKSPSNVLYQLESFVISSLKNDSIVYFGVFPVPYLNVPEIKDVVDSYHLILNSISKQERERFYYFHLASYATETEGTKVWYLNNREHNQDFALIKEVIRFYSKGYGPTFGVSSYVLNPGKLFQTEKDVDIDYDKFQIQINEFIEKRIANKESFLNYNEIELNEYFERNRNEDDDILKIFY